MAEPEDYVDQTSSNGDTLPEPPPEPREELISIVGSKEERKVKARREPYKSVWFGLGMFGMIGWSVAIPTLACIALGIWIDTHWPSRYSWTLMLLFVGMALGCWNAWYWVVRERNLDGR